MAVQSLPVGYPGRGEAQAPQDSISEVVSTHSKFRPLKYLDPGMAQAISTPGHMALGSRESWSRRLRDATGVPDAQPSVGRIQFRPQTWV